MRFAIFQQIDRAPEIVLDDLATGDTLRNPGKHTGVGRCIDDPVRGLECSHVTRAANIEMAQPHSQFLENKPIQLASRPAQIVEADDLQAFPRLEQARRNRAPGKATGAG